MVPWGDICFLKMSDSPARDGASKVNIFHLKGNQLPCEPSLLLDTGSNEGGVTAGVLSQLLEKLTFLEYSPANQWAEESGAACSVMFLGKGFQCSGIHLREHVNTSMSGTTPL